MKLNLAKNGSLGTEQAKLLTEIERHSRKRFNAYIGELVKHNKVEGLVWLARVTSRNTFAGTLYDKLCKLSLLKHLLAKNESISVIIVDSAGMYEAVDQIMAKHSLAPRVVLKRNYKNNLFYLLATNVFKSLYLVLNMWLWPKLIPRSIRPDAKPAILIDTFLYPDSYKADSGLLSRNYPGLLDNVAHITDKYDVVLMPTFYHIRTPLQFILAYWRTYRTDEKVLLKEYYLKAGDYLKALIKNYSIPFKINKYPEWDGLNISKIILEERNGEYSTTTLLNSLLLYYFLRRLSKQKKKLALVIDWNENQVIDRALNLAIKKYHPETYVVGYQGFIVPGYYLSVNPTPYELTGETLPQEMCVIGKSYKEEKLAQCEKLYVSIAPAYRFKDIIRLYNERSQQKPENRVVVALPLFLPSCNEILTLCEKVAGTLPETEFVVKYHPAHNQKKIRKLIKNSDNKLIFTSKRIGDLLETAGILVSEASSVCMEGAVLGIPVAIVGSHTGPTMNPLEGLVQNGRWGVVYNAKELQSFIEENIENTEPTSLEIEDYFEGDNGQWLNDLVQKVENRQ